MKTLNELLKYKLEQRSFRLADKYITDYEGGRWTFNDALQIWTPPAPDDGMLSLINEDNYSDIRVPAEWAAMCIGSIACNQLCWEAHGLGHDEESRLWEENQRHLAQIADEEYKTCEHAAKFFQFID